MAQTTEPREVLSVLCDDVRLEIGNKVSLMGLYGEALVFRELPGQQARLTLFKAIEGGDGEFAASLDVIGPDKHSMLKGGAKEFGPVKLGGDARAALATTLGPLTFEKPGAYDVVLKLSPTQEGQQEYMFRHAFRVTTAD